MRWTAETYRARLRATLTSQGAAYGFTLTIWGSGALAVAVHGQFTVTHTLLFIAGPLASYGILLIFLYRPTDRPAALHPETIRAFAFLDYLSVPVAIGVALLTYRLIKWPLVAVPVGSFLATTVYNLLLAAQVWILVPPGDSNTRG